MYAEKHCSQGFNSLLLDGPCEDVLVQDAFKAVHNDYRRSTSCAGRVQRLGQQTKKYVPSSTIKWALLRDQRMKASTRMARAQTTTRADTSTQPQSPQMDEDASLNDYWAEVFNRQWDMERYAEFQWLCERTQMPCVSGKQWLQLGHHRQHVLMRLLRSMDKASSVACAEHGS